MDNWYWVFALFFLWPIAAVLWLAEVAALAGVAGAAV